MKKRIIKMGVSTTLALSLLFSSIAGVPNAKAAVKPKKLVLNKTKLTLNINQSYKLKVKSVKPKKASKAVFWKTNNKLIVKVTKTGKVTALSSGTAKVTATSKKNKKVRVFCVITVKDTTENTTVTPTETPKLPVPSAASSQTPAASVVPTTTPVTTNTTATTSPSPSATPNGTDTPSSDTPTASSNPGEIATGSAIPTATSDPITNTTAPTEPSTTTEPT